ncbi:energy transducer TonB [Methylomonas sp. DH-1]|uniref:energy transducer TonB n=1 Tax=Methylomonas sp. (strain DH-1) TaxID=1727196 RepID=UPI0007C8C93D|nr:energy transducer TonB [Methylomonas sp. DH-1]ANE55109.1 energy transducer TonB [Methylomonas sp. DH-1]
MSTPFATIKHLDAESWTDAEVPSLKPAANSLLDGFAQTPLANALQSFKYTSKTRDHKLVDFLAIGVLSVLIHTTLLEQFRGAALEQDFVEPVKKPPKVQITLSRPRPVAPPPPVVREPPKPKVVPLKPPKVKPKPVKQEAEPAPIPDPTPGPVSDSAPPAPPAPPAPVVEEKITPPTAGADYLHNPPPEYPDIAQERGWEGKVLMKVHVQADGKPDNITVIKTSGQKVLDDAAVKTVSKWSFVPAKRGDTPVAGYVTVPITFNLS